MVTHFDHVTIVVRDVEAAKVFFGLLGFQEDKSVVIAGPQFSSYMGVDGIEAEHVTLVLADVSPRTEVQLLKYRHPDLLRDPAIGDLTKLGFNHICFAVDDLEAEVAKLSQRCATPERDHGLPQPQAGLSVRPGRHHRGTGRMGWKPRIVLSQPLQQTGFPYFFSFD